MSNQTFPNHQKVFGGTNRHTFQSEYDKLTNTRLNMIDVKKQTLTDKEDGWINYMDNGWITVSYFDGLYEIWQPLS